MLRLFPFATTALTAIATGACVSIPIDRGPDAVPGVDVRFARIDVGPFPRVDPGDVLTGDLPPREVAVEAVADLEADFASAGFGDYELRVVTDDYDLPEVVLTVRAAD